MLTSYMTIMVFRDQQSADSGPYSSSHTSVKGNSKGSKPRALDRALSNGVRCVVLLRGTTSHTRIVIGVPDGVSLTPERPLSISEMSSGSWPTLEGLLEQENFLVHVCQWKDGKRQRAVILRFGRGFETALPEPHSTLTVSLNNRSNVAPRGRCLRRIE
ncbi:hypothetical protein I7I51_05427 [Histoplasma capsulatum]|uniref:Uncharacterized protein n=1 Tax=Ajellomyces capsulatus TaxID=5037 RepID=A0A8A1M2C4_AJECA|nr:hypothetical protein I7I51_05427 [Histoplasma capsulatum]